MTTVALRNLGRFGNQLFRYAYARALCEQNGFELRTEPWVGERVFTLDGLAPKRPDGTEDIVIDEYRQAQKDLIYTRADCRRWFELKPKIEDELEVAAACYFPVVVHFRRGDYVGSSGYPVIGRKAVVRAMLEHRIASEFCSVSDDHPLRHSRFPSELEFLPDFYRLMKAPILFRANSSFSWWAATLGTGRVLSPVITGLAGGVEHVVVPFVEGNWPRLAELEFVTDLHLKEV